MRLACEIEIQKRDLHKNQSDKIPTQHTQRHLIYKNKNKLKEFKKKKQKKIEMCYNKCIKDLVLFL